MPSAPTRLEAFQGAPGCVVRVVGRGTMRESQVFHEYARRYLETAPENDRSPEDARLILDLSACEWLDSTFLGCLVDLHKRFNRGGERRFLVAGPAPLRKKFLGACRLDRLLPGCDEPPPVTGEGAPLTASAPLEPRALGYHVLQCHRRLAEQGGPSSAAFARVADQLEKELSASRSA